MGSSEVMLPHCDRWLGVDTSNYTTSVGILDANGNVCNQRKLLPVPAGEKGLRQSDALFFHVRQFGEVFSRTDTDGIRAIGVSTRPRNENGSYMPCFLAGESYAEVLSRAWGVPLFRFSHQQGHIAAGLLSVGCTDWIRRPFLAFHLSGGTLELVSVHGLGNIRVEARTLDLTAGQLIDRIGVCAGLSFPAGAEMDRLSCHADSPVRPRICLKGRDCCLSGFENKAQEMLKGGVPVGDVSAFLFETVAQTVGAMVEKTRDALGMLPCLFVGGVMANSRIRRVLQTLPEVRFASPELSSDNAVGVAWLARLASENGGVLV